MRRAPGRDFVLAAGIAALVCAGCGSSSSPTALTPVSLQELRGNSAIGVTYDVNVAADGRVNVHRLVRTVHRTATKWMLIVTDSVGRGRLNAAEDT